MRIIIPMAGLGKRLRPFTLTTAKPLLKLAGKSIVRRLVEKIIAVSNAEVTDIAFVIGDFPQQVIDDLHELGRVMNFKVHIVVQEVALGTAHAVYMAKSIMQGEVIVAFADTLFDADFVMRRDADVVIWTKHVSNPELYGVVMKDDNDQISAFHEKPQKFVSDEAIIGIYYFNDAAVLLSYLENLINNNNRLVNGEFQLTDVLQDMLDNKLLFVSQSVDAWLDCGNTALLLSTVSHLLAHSDFDSHALRLTNSVIIEPVYLGNSVTISNSVIGPNVSIEDGAVIADSIISNSIVYEYSYLSQVNLSKSIVGNFATVNGKKQIIELGDYGKISL